MEEQTFNELLALVKGGLGVTDALKKLRIPNNRYYNTATYEQKELLINSRIGVNHRKPGGPTVKICRKCREEKPIEQFYSSESRCKPCIKAGKDSGISTARLEEKLKEVRDKNNIRIIKGFKFDGDIPHPKDDSYYKRY